VWRNKGELKLLDLRLGSKTEELAVEHNASAVVANPRPLPPRCGRRYNLASARSAKVVTRFCGRSRADVMMARDLSANRFPLRWIHALAQRIASR